MYLCLSSPYMVKNDFLSYIRNFNTNYALLPIEEKKNVQNTLLNVLVEPSQYKAVKTYKARQVAIANTRPNTKEAISNTCTVTKNLPPAITETQTKTLSNQSESNATLYNTIYTLTEALSNVDEATIRASGKKASDLTEKKNIVSGFTYKEFFVKSYSRPNDPPHVIKIDEHRLIRCGSHCPRYNVNRFFGHVIAVSLQSKCSCALQKCGEKSTALIASQKIDTGIVGREKVTRSRKKQIGEIEPRERGTYFKLTFCYHQSE